MKIHNKLIKSKLVAGNTDLCSNFIITILTRTGLHTFLSISISDCVHSSPRGTRHIFFLSFLDGGMAVCSLRHQELCDCFVSECDDSQSCLSGSGSAGKSFLSFRPFTKKVFSFLERSCKLPRS